ncbi:MAG: hypothetical protein M0Q88_04785 [Bacilli bacterium]|nr:hypothetical protein [Bacilli bacterium]
MRILVGLTFIIKGEDYWVITFVVFVLYLFYRIIRLLVLKSRIYKEKYSEIDLNNPIANIMVVKNRYGNTYPGIYISGVINGKKKKISLYRINSNQKELKEEIKEISSKPFYTCTLINGFDIVFNHYRENIQNIETKKIKEKVYYKNLNSSKEKRVKYENVLFEIDKIINLLKTSDEVEEIFIVNKENKYVKILMYPEDLNQERDFFIDNNIYSINELFSYLELNGFIEDNRLKVFEQFDGNSPSLLANKLK